MANNRMSLKCKQCGEEQFIAKRMASAYYGFSSVDKFNKFLDAHEYCNGSLDCFEISYDIDPDYDIQVINCKIAATDKNRNGAR